MTSMPLYREPDNEAINEWDDLETVPTPDLSDFEVFADNVLIRPYQPPKNHKVAGGGVIYLPDQVDHDRHFLQNCGQLVKIGNLAFRDPNVKPADGNYFPYGYYQKPWAKEGDWVLFPRNAGQKIKYKGVKMVLMKDTFLLGKLSSPEDISVNYQTIVFD